MTGNRLKPVAAQSASTSAAVEPRRTVVSDSGRIMTPATVFSVKPSAPASRSYSSLASSPSPRDSSTSAATSSRVKVELISSFGSTRSSRRIAFAIASSATMTGLSTVTQRKHRRRRAPGRRGRGRRG